MKVVVLSLTDPWRHAHGGTLRTRALVDALLHLGHEVSAVFPAPPGGDPSVDAAAPPSAAQVVAVPGSTLGARRWPGWVTTAKRTLLPLPTAVGGRSASLAAAVRAQGPADLLLVSVLPFAQHLRELPGAGLWVDHSDLYSDVLAREAARRRGVARLTATGQLAAVRRSEDRLVATSAATTAAGAADAEALQRRSGHPVHWLPTPVASADVPRRPSARPTAGFFGNFAYWPNVDAWELLRDTWAPRLREQGWDVLVAGHGSDELAGGDGVRLVGPVATPSDFYASVDVALAPVRVGGGMKVKVVEALAHRRPVLATRFALAGFPDEVAEAAVVVDEDGAQLAGLSAAPALPADVGSRLGAFTGEGFREAVARVLAERRA